MKSRIILLAGVFVFSGICATNNSDRKITISTLGVRSISPSNLTSSFSSGILTGPQSSQYNRIQLADGSEPIPPRAISVIDGSEPIPPRSFTVADGSEPIPPRAISVIDGSEPIPPRSSTVAERSEVFQNDPFLLRS